MSKTNNSETTMEKVAALIVDKRNLVFLVLIIGVVFSFFSRNWVQVENSLPEYLPADSESRQGLDIMEEQFITYGTAYTNLCSEKRDLESGKRRKNGYLFCFRCPWNGSGICRHSERIQLDDGY